MVVVKKTNGKNQIYMDYIDLNKVCPKDLFPVSHIDLMVNATVGHNMLSFMDTYSGYN